MQEWTVFFYQSGQRFDTNSANEGSTNKLETNGFAGSQQQQVNAQQMYTNNPGQLNTPKDRFDYLIHWFVVLVVFFILFVLIFYPSV